MKALAESYQSIDNVVKHKRSNLLWLTPTSITRAVLAVTEKLPGLFTVEVALPQPDDISFDWFVIGGE